MSHESQQDYASEKQTPGTSAANDTHDIPARGTASSKLSKPEQPVTSGLVKHDKVVELPPIHITAPPQTPIGTATAVIPYNGTAPITPCSFAYGAGAGPEELDGSWTSKPAFVGVLPVAGSGETFDSLRSAREAFSAAWNTTQASWTKALPIADRYRNAQVDADLSHKGLADFGNKKGTLDQSIEDLTFSTQTKVFDAFDTKGKVVSKNPNFTKADPAIRQQIAAIKKEIADADAAIDKQNSQITQAQIALSSASKRLSIACLALTKAEVTAQIDSVQRKGEAYTNAAGRIATAADGLSALAGNRFSAAAPAAKVINTLYWEADLAEIQRELDNLKGQSVAADVLSAHHGVLIARDEVARAKAMLQDAKLDYDTRQRDRALKFRKLGPLLATASGLPNKDAAKVSVAVQAKPVIELALSSAQDMNAAIDHVPPETDEARRGCTLATNRDELIERYGILKLAKKLVQLQEQKWATRLQSVDALIDGAHD